MKLIMNCVCDFICGKSGNIAKNSVNLQVLFRETIIACCIPFFCVVTDNQLFMVANDLTELFCKKRNFRKVSMC